MGYGHNIKTVCAVLERSADRGGLVANQKAWREFDESMLDPQVVDRIVAGLEEQGYLWSWGKNIILVRPVLCPSCNVVVHKTITRHMHEDHPRPTSEVAWVEWA
jgi:hypothetical protein